MPLNIQRRSATPFLSQQFSNKLCEILASRGVSDEREMQYGAGNLLHFNQLRGIERTVEILLEVKASGQKLLIVGDFDADGATSTAVLKLGLSMLGFSNVDFLVPNRFEYGYGLSPEIVELALANGAQCIITVDNGISSIEGVALAKQQGLTVVVTDHHLPPESLPDADAIVNPNLSDCQFPSKNLAGVGVAFYLLLALRAEQEKRGVYADNTTLKPNIASMLDLVALGTVADVVPMDRNNRILVHQGIQRIRSGRCRPGISAILQIAKKSAHELQASDLGFVIGPRLNAAGRLDDMSVGIRCLLEEDSHKAYAIAAELDALNQERRQIEQDMQQDAAIVMEQMQFSDEQRLPSGIALYQPDWHQGIVGIVAGRVKEKYFRPVFAFALQEDGLLKGSGRSISGLHLKDLLEEMSQRYPGLLKKFGGHAAAAGLTIAETDFQQFSDVFEQLCSESLDENALQQVWHTDGALTHTELDMQFVQALQQAGPFGQAFPEPSFDGVFTLEDQRIVGAKHLKMQVRHEQGTLLDAIAFNVDLEQWPNSNAQQVQLVYKLDINEFRGRRSLQLIVDALAAQ